MATKNYNKVVYGGKTLIDLTSDTITASDLAKGITAHDKSGAKITGTCTKDVDSSTATAMQAEILTGKTAFARGTKLTGTMPNNGKQTSTISDLEDSITIAQGYHDGSGSVSISQTEKNKLISTNIREGVTVLGVVGTMSGSEDEHPEESREVTPATTQQTITPGEGYTCFREIIVKAIPYVESDNSAGALTVTIGA